ncbi:MAG: acyl-CoA thioesterase [Planctomycetota bacterium]
MTLKSGKLPLPGEQNSCQISHRVTYAEVDRMSYVYYGNYAVWFETGRTEFIRSTGISYLEMEDSGFYLPVRRCDTRYHKAARYDDAVKIVTVLNSLKKASINFLTVIYDNKDNLLAEGHVELACTNSNGAPVAIPKALKEKLSVMIWED